MPNKVYDILKWIVLVFAPALIALLTGLLPIFGVDPEICDKIIQAVSLITAFLGALLGFSSISYKKKSEEKNESDSQ